MDDADARRLVTCCLPKFEAGGLPPLDATAMTRVQAKRVATLWAGYGSIFKLMVEGGSAPISIIVKRVELPSVCDSIGDQRKKDSYDVEAAFYAKGHAEKLRAAGAMVPFPLHVEKQGEDVTICMTEVKGSSSHRGESEAFVEWLAKAHALYWGDRATEACGQSSRGGLQAQGTYWHLDTRPDEHRRMGSSGWMGRLKLAARAIDLRLKADPLQSVVHGDAKGANIVYATGDDGKAIPLVYDFQYCGKGAVAKDLAYFFNVEADASAEDQLLRHYHSELKRLLEAQGVTPPTFEALQTSHELALCDWRRFTEIGLGGWGDSRANRRVQKLLDRLDGGQPLASEQKYIEALQREFPV